MPSAEAKKAFNEGGTHWRARAYCAALACYDHAIALEPDYAGAHFNRGVTLKMLDRLEEALESLARASVLQPDAKSFTALGNTLRQSERHKEAEQAYAAALALDPAHAAAQIGRIESMLTLRRFEDAIVLCDAALAVTPVRADVVHAKGWGLIGLRRIAAAIAEFKRATILDPNLAAAYIDWGLALKFLGRPERESWAITRQGLMRDEGALKRFVVRAARQLLSGQYELGFFTYEVREHYAQFCRDHGITAPIWLGGSDIAGETILITTELGLGDTIQFSRYIPMLEQAGATVLFSPQPALRALMRSLSPTVRIVDVATDTLAYDRHCRVISLAAAFNTSIDTIPGRMPYLAADPERVDRWRARIGGAGFKIGISWRGSKDGVAGGRSIPLTAFAGLAAIPGVRLISLQKGDGLDELNGLPFAVETLGDDFDAGDAAFLDTAAAMEACDLVISCDTSIGHLAGALGRPTWIALNSTADWRWMKERTDTPWYPKALLFRQKTPGGWDEALAGMEVALRAAVAAA